MTVSPEFGDSRWPHYAVEASTQPPSRQQGDLVWAAGRRAAGANLMKKEQQHGHAGSDQGSSKDRVPPAARGCRGSDQSRAAQLREASLGQLCAVGGARLSPLPPITAFAPQIGRAHV